MRTEPDLDKHSLLAVLRDRYLFDVERLEFVPHGIDSWSYVAVLRDDARRFVKLVRAGPPGEASASGSELPMLAALADLGGVRVARPIVDRDGRLVNAIDGFELYVLEYLDGQTLGDERIWPDALYASVAEAVAAIHRSTSAVRHLIPGVERFELPFLAPLVATLAVHGERDPLPADLRDLLAPMALDIRTGVNRLTELRDIARSRHTDDVLCHTDIWGSNLMLSDGGVLNVLDWGGALIAPVEADLFMFAGTGFYPADRFGWFLGRYEAAFRRVDLDADVFGFYLYRRNLDDLSQFIADLARESTEAMDRDEALGLTADLLAELPGLEERIDAIRRMLHERGQRLDLPGPSPERA